MQFIDRLTIDSAQRTKDGYLRVVAKGARSGIQKYLGREVDPEGKHFAADAVVSVYRPPEEVFDQRALASFVGRPITDDHPAESVTAKNWRDHSRGVIGGAVKDGEWVRFDLAFMDAALIDKVDAGKRELSCGYGCTLSIEDGQTADGQPYQAVQRSLSGNHIAVVARARAGSEARISDGGNALFQSCDAATVILPTLDGAISMSKKIMLDGLTVDLSDAAAVEVAIGKLQTKLSDAETATGKLTADLATASTTIQTKDGEIAALKQQLADATDPAKVQQLADERAALIASAKRLLPSVVTDGKTGLEIKRAVVTARLGDAATKDMADAAVEGAFMALAPTQDAKADPVRNVIAGGLGGHMVDAASIRNAARAASLN